MYIQHIAYLCNATLLCFFFAHAYDIYIYFLLLFTQLTALINTSTYRVYNNYKIYNYLSPLHYQQYSHRYLHYLHDYYIMMRTLPKIKYDHLQY